MKGYVWMAALALAANLGFSQAQQPNTILYNGKILTVDRNFSTAQAVAVRGTQIAAVGTNDEVLRMAGPNTLKIDLKGRTVTPGLIHTHVHLEEVGGYRDLLPAAKRGEFPLNFRGAKNKDDILKQIRDIIAAFKFPAGQWIYFPSNPQGLEHAKIIFDQLTTSELDKAAPNNPIVVGVGMPKTNIALVSGKGIEWLWKKYGDYLETYGRYWIDANGKPSGILESPGVRILWEDPEISLNPEPADVAPMYKQLLEEQFASLGVTTISGSLDTDVVRAYQLVDSRGEMPVRYGYGAMSAFMPYAKLSDYKLGAGTDNVFITSMSARAVDGAGGRMCISLPRNDDAVREAEGDTASLMGLGVSSEWWPRGQCALDIEYNGGTRGARIKANWFMQWYNDVAQAGLRSANSHVAGNDSHSRIISEWEKIDAAKPGSVKGWAMDHCELIDPKDIPRAGKLGLMWSCNPSTAVGTDVATAFGENILHTYAVPTKTMLNAGINVSLEGEWGDIETLIVRKDEDGKVWGPNERVDRKTALIIATQNGANYVLKGDKLGSIEPGKFADLVVIDRDYMTIPEEDISETRALMTMMGGRIVFVDLNFSNEANLKPAGAVINTREELLKRRPAGGFGGGG
jgi:predicted amidohydrolase YtcJ